MENQKDFQYMGQILQQYPRDKRFLLAILQDIQKQYNYLPRKSLHMVQEYMDIPLAKLYAMATFYKALSLKPKGRYVIKVCDGTACHIGASQTLIHEIANLLKLTPGQTTSDGRFSLETVNCLGSCAAAPVMVVNDKFYGKVHSSMVKAIIGEYGGISS
jgi:NADH:ubiquinone oxidoreductase subunit E